ncbi:MAG: nitroreductase family deazaflavin-dependent oxidoreductase [Candidatus Ranarchaeia archaeon]|jgi:deazaflavin-dependent oxidoreductase (nitroreductase family)
MMKMSLPKPIWRLMRIPRLWYKLGLGHFAGRIFLLLTTKGRKTGKWHTVPLQYTKDGQVYYVGSARGTQADWFKNIVVNPSVEVHVKRHRFKGEVRIITEQKQIVEYLHLQMQRHPIFMKLILRMRGLTTFPSPQEIQEYSKSIALVSIQPTSSLPD